MGQIATKAFCNGLHSGAFSGDTTQCPTRSQLESAGFTIIGGSYATNQCVQQEHIGYDWTEYTFSVTPDSVEVTNTGGSNSFTVTSYSITYRNSTSGTRVQIRKAAVDYSATNSGPATVSKGSVSSSTYKATYTITLPLNNSSGNITGTITFKQNGSGYTDTGTYLQKPGQVNWGKITINSVSANDIPASGGTISSGTISYSQEYGYGSSNTGYTSSSGATVTWGSVSAGTRGTTTGARQSVGTLTVKVSRGGQETSSQVTIYQAKNSRYTGATQWDSWSSWSVDLSVSETTFGSDGGTASVTGSASRSRRGTIPYTYDSGATSSTTTWDYDSASSISVSSNASWAKLSSSTTSCNLNVGTYSENDTRTATITGTYEGASDTVTVSQSGLKITYDTYTMTVSPTSDTHSAAGDTTDLTINATRKVYHNGEYYTTESCAWSRSYSSVTGFTVSGSSSGTGSGSNTVKTDYNPNTTSRSITITYTNTYNTGVTASCTITQSGNVWTYTFTVSPSSCSWDYNQSGTSSSKTISVTSRKSGTNGQTAAVGWSSSGKPSWLTQGSTTGNGSTSGSNSVSVYPDSTNSGNTRSGTITFTQKESNKTDSVTVSQGANVTYSYQYKFSRTPSSLSFDSSGGTKNVTVTSQRRKITETGGSFTSAGSWENYGFSSSETLSWISTSTSGTTIKVTATENTSTSKRDGTLTIKQNSQDNKCTLSGYGSDSPDLNVPLSQAYGNYVLDIKKDTDSGYKSSISYTFPAVELPRYNFDVRSTFNGADHPFTAQSSVDWILINYPVYPDSGNDISFQVENNTSSGQREGTITITQDDSNKKVYIYITQGGRKYQYKFSVTPTSLSFFSSGGTEKVSVTSQRRVISVVDSSSVGVGSWESATFTSSSSSISWVTTTRGSDYVKVTAKENTSSSDRSGEIQVSQTQTSKYTGSDYPSDSDTISVSVRQNKLSHLVRIKLSESPAGCKNIIINGPGATNTKLSTSYIQLEAAEDDRFYITFERCTGSGNDDHSVINSIVVDIGETLNLSITSAVPGFSCGKAGTDQIRTSFDFFNISGSNVYPPSTYNLGGVSIPVSEGYKFYIDFNYNLDESISVE